MGYSNLVDLIKSIENGTNLKIGVIFFGDYGNEKFVLPKENRIHTSAVCESIKSQPQRYKRCYKCKNIAIQKAVKNQQGFGGVCIHGVYEYTHPVIDNGNVVAIIFISNILEKNHPRLDMVLEDKTLLSTMEQAREEQTYKSLAMVIESYIKLISINYQKTQKSFNPLIQNFKDFIEDNLEYGVGAEQLAEMFHYNKKYLGRLFKKQTGLFLTDYVNERRIERAKDLLNKGEYSITQVSLKVGIDNVPYFNRLFKKMVGITPSEYRKNQISSAF
jgi:YesN/AraC family two-component response regulator